ncbi:Ribose-phosphate pyrophosphokinase [Candidatus Trichorickettsia mobilis]|uniref:ribose-phosphate diphosphokinase n=1 Tax=Candidatus Trichorickettsia mobilis TaxID=1346319 RepID=A0ABZ0UXA2_9RICK|nr:ribose-phosphate diphosphokinase [Candidatus Trichorickettsia mobilis]WPY01267.1 Ribose-phosphate pyrophosphokinase [Candidatus Trichorickettsia mobilis]
MLKITSGSSHIALAKQLSKQLEIEYITADIQKFADEELRIQFTVPLYADDIIIVQSTSKPANDYLMELLLLVDAVKCAGAQRIIALMPYFGYSRQDRPSYNYGPISARLIATLLETAGVDQLITVDLHSSQVEGFFKIGVKNIDPISLFTTSITENHGLVVVSPDIGGINRAQKLSSYLGVDIAIINKIRNTHNKCSMQQLIGNVAGKKCLLIDDIVDTGNTICQATDLLLDKGAVSVEAFITHAVLSELAISNIMQSRLEKISITNSIVHDHLPKKFQVIDLNSILAQAITTILT